MTEPLAAQPRGAGSNAAPGSAAAPAARLEGSILFVTGPLTMETVPAVVEAGAAAIREVRTIDLSDVTDVDSAAVALLLEWVKHGDRSLIIRGAPAPLRTLAALYEMDGLLPFAAD